MANETFLDASGNIKYRASTGAGTAGDPAITITSIDGSVAVTGTFWQATQPVSIASSVAVTGPLTDAQLRATAVPVSLTSTTITGTVAATQSGTWTVTGSGGTFPVTDSGGSLTVDAPVGTPVFVRLSDGSSAITTLPVSLTSTTITGSVAVTNAGTFAVQVSSALPAGTNNIGDVDIASGTLTTVTTVTSLTQFNGQAIALGSGASSAGTLRVMPASDATVGLQAGTLVVGQVVTRPDVSNASDGSLTLTPKFARLSTASTGNQAIVSAVTGKKIRVLSMNVMATASTNAIWINDGTADLHGNTTYKIPLDVTGATGAGGFVLPYNQLGWFETAATNRPLNINLGSANGITAIVTYVEV